jgi:hypothetical protein
MASMARPLGVRENEDKEKDYGPLMIA